MPLKIKFYIILATGVIVLLVGLVNFIASYGDTTFSGIIGQVTSVIVVLGGFVNLIVAGKLKSDVTRAEAIKSEKRRKELE